MEWFETVFLSFFIYSFLGWIWESVFYSLWDKHKLVNRGFMFGPYIPIYGTGALIDLVLLGDIHNVILLFFVSAFLCCAVEYFVSWAMEKMFHARWWDYTDMLLHINGRVCIEGFFAFGLLSVALVQWIQPFTMDVLGMIPKLWLHITAGLTFALFVTDFVISVKHAADFGRKIQKIAEAFSEFKEKVASFYDTVVVDTFFRKVIDQLTTRQKRLLYAFPKMRSISYPGVIRAIRNALPGGAEEFIRKKFHSNLLVRLLENDITAAPSAEKTPEEIAAAEKAVEEFAEEKRKSYASSQRAGKKRRNKGTI
ncbi:MAG: putative ABC transporter permease [Lachnospiraceae bacterium]|nr:putative ABC transporter permease [Lachnospiraceae bacterium]